MNGNTVRPGRGFVKIRPRLVVEDAAIVAVTFVFLIFMVFPFLWVVLTSIRPDAEMFTRTLQILPSRVTTEQYRALFASGSNFPRYILNSIFVCLVSTVLTVLISILAAYGFSRFVFAGRRKIIAGFAFSQLFPFVVLLLPLYIVFWRLNLVNRFTGLILAYVAITLPFCVYMLLGYFQSVPKSIDEAAVIDGCSTPRVIFSVVLPIAWPGIAATAVYAFVRSWNEYLFALTLMTDESRKTIPVGLANFFGQYTTDWGAVMSASVVATLPTLVFFLFMQRQLVSGLAAGAVKQ